MERRLLKSETTEWFEEISDDGTRRVRMETKVEKWFADELDSDGQTLTRHNPVVSHIVEYL